MKVILKTNKPMFGQLQCGTVFIDADGDVSMKTNGHVTHMDIVYGQAVRLSDGLLYRILPTTHVEVCDATVTVLSK